jgi:hypothetical protein
VEYITQIGYFSTAAGPQVPTVVHDILTVARRVNRSMGVTGLLVAGSNRYLQVIEGPDPSVRSVYDKIMADDRHIGVTQFLSRPVTERSFGSWSMAFRRPSTSAEPEDFLALLRGLTAELAGTQLARQIAHFARAIIRLEEEQQKDVARSSSVIRASSKPMLETA